MVETRKQISRRDKAAVKSKLKVQILEDLESFEEIGTENGSQYAFSMQKLRDLEQVEIE